MRTRRGWPGPGTPAARGGGWGGRAREQGDPGGAARLGDPRRPGGGGGGPARRPGVSVSPAALPRTQVAGGPPRRERAAAPEPAPPLVARAGNPPDGDEVVVVR